MADRYWVGGSGTWNSTSTTNWSATSGGASGASVPTAADNVIFNQAGTYTVTTADTIYCLDLTVTAGTVTFAGSGLVRVSGSFTLLSGTVWNVSTGELFFTSSVNGRTITTNGTTLNTTVNFDGTGSWTLASALTLSNKTFNLLRGTFNTGNFNMSGISYIYLSGTSVRQMNLGSSTINIGTSGTGGVVWLATTTTNLTFNAGTSSIFIASVTTSFDGGGLTYYNVTYTYTNDDSSNAILGTNTFNNLSFAATASPGVITVNFSDKQTINGILSTSGTAGNRRVLFRSGVDGIAIDLVVNSAPSLTDADFQDLYVTGTAAPITGTRIGDLGRTSGITFSTPKIVYWNKNGSSLWTDTAWSTSMGGATSNDNFPLPQDTAIFSNTGLPSTVNLSGLVPNISTVDFSKVTNAVTVTLDGVNYWYGDIIFSSSVTLTGPGTQTFRREGTQTIISAGKQFPANVAVDSFSGTVVLGDALSINASYSLFHSRGGFNTNNFNVTTGSYNGNNTNRRTLSLGSSTVTINGVPNNAWTINATNLTFNAGTSTVSIARDGGLNSKTPIMGTGLTYYNVSFVGYYNRVITFTGSFTCNNLTLTTSDPDIGIIELQNNIVVNGTFSATGPSVTNRLIVRGSLDSAPTTITAAAAVLTNVDFRSIILAGAAAGTTTTSGGNCGNNTGITFTTPKTVYWNLSGTQNWNSTGWATSSGGTPAANNFPLPQDTAIFDNTGAAGTVTINRAWSLPAIDMSARTTAMSLPISGVTATLFIYGDIKLGTGVTFGSGGTLSLHKFGTQTITSNGASFSCNVWCINPSGTVQLADALTLGSTNTLRLGSATFNAVTFNVTIGLFFCISSSGTLKMGTGTWTLSGTGTIWDCGSSGFLPILEKGTANIVLSDNTTSSRTFYGGGGSYNKLTIGGNTSTSTTDIYNYGTTFTELASTKTVAHTISFAFFTPVFGKWSVTGTLGNVVTVSGSGAFTIAGPATSGLNYLAMGSTPLSTTSPGEFYAGPNSTGTGSGIILTAAPTPRTLYWVGGTGNWSDTARWSTTSGGAGGAAIPTSLDNVIFNSASNATSYTATIDPTQARCKALTISGPASGTLSLAGSGGLALHGSANFIAGFINGYSGPITLSGGTTGLTFTSNGNSFPSDISVNGFGAEWTLGSALTTTGNTFGVYAGTLDMSVYNFSVNLFTTQSYHSKTVKLGTGTITFTGTPVFVDDNNSLTLVPGTSSIIVTAVNTYFYGAGKTFYNVTFQGATGGIEIVGQNTFNTLTVTSLSGIRTITLANNQTVTNLVTTPGGNATVRCSFVSKNIGSTRTITCSTATLTDTDFRDITIAGAAAPASGTRIGDLKGNTGITFTAAANKYWNLATGGNWDSTAWALTSGGTPAANNFPLAQDTCIFEATGLNSGATITINQSWNIGTVNMSARTTNTMTLNVSAFSYTIYGNWINGTGVTISGTGILYFSGRSSQTITSNGVSFSNPINISTAGGTLTLQDSLTSSSNSSEALKIEYGTLNANGFNITLTDSSSGFNVSSYSNGVRTAALGSGTVTIAGTNGWNASISTNLTVTGTGIISLTSSSSKSFQGGSLSYSGITINQGGAGTLTFSGNNTIKTITNTYANTGNTTISFGSSIQQLVSLWQATGGASDRVLSITGSSTINPAQTVYTGENLAAQVNFLTVTNVQAFNIRTPWYAGASSTNNGSYGWIFETPLLLGSTQVTGGITIG